MKITRHLAALAVTAVLLASCGGSDDDENTSDMTSTTSTTSSNPASPPSTAGTTPATPAPGAATGDAVEIVDFAYEPTPLEVAVGTTVTFTNADDDAHTATSDRDAPKAFDTGDLEKGASKPVVFDAPGTYPYFCDIHNYMKGQIEVK